MRQKFYFFSLIAALLVVFSFTGCNNRNAFDFSQLDEIDANGDWGFPLVNAEYTIGDIMDMSNNTGVIHQGADGTLEIRYEYTFDSVLSAAEYLDSYLGDNISVSGTKTFSSAGLPPMQGNVQVLYHDTLKAQFPADQIQIESASLKSGQIAIQVTYNVSQPTQIDVTCPQLTSASGQPFHMTAQASGGSYSTTLDLSGYSLHVTSNNEVDFFMEVSCNANLGTMPDELTFSYSASFHQVAFREIRGRFTAVDLPLDKEWDFDSQFLRDHISGNMTLLNPQVTCEIMNTFPVRGTLILNQAQLSGGGYSASLLSHSPATIQIPGSTNQFTPVSLPIANSLLLSPNYDHFKLNGSAIINPDGFSTPTLVFRDDQYISLRVTVVLPFEMNMEDIAFCDTIQFGGINVPNESAFSNLLMRLGIENGLPLNFQLQAYFYDSQTATIKDSLFTNPQPVLSAQNGVPRMSELFASKDNFEEVRRMLECDNIILRARIYTDGAPISINVAQSLRVHLSARMNVNLNGLVDLGN